MNSKVISILLAFSFSLFVNTLAIELPPCDRLDKLTPDPLNCSRFYECCLSGWVRLDCPAGLYFNPNTDQCDYPENVDCPNSNVEDAAELPPCDQLDKLTPDPKNCSRFYECCLSGWVRLDCPSGLYFNPNSDRCDYPENVDCPIPDVKETIELPPCDQLDKLTPDPRNCSRFYECCLSGWVRLDCPAGLYFNPNSDQCDYPENVDCQIPDVKETIELPPCDQLDKLTPDPKNCSRFYECCLSGWVRLDCPAGLDFNPNTDRCDYPENVDCQIPNVKKTTQLPACNQLSKLIPDPKRCNRFYECATSGWVGFDCPAGLYFNKATLHCDYPKNVRC